MRYVRAAGATLVVMALACAPEAPTEPQLCEGKCDGNVAAKFVDLFQDPSRFEAGDLSKWSADLVTKEINGLLARVPLFQPRLSKTDVYGLEERAERSFTIKSLPALTAGLAQSYGEQELATRINVLRRQHLERNPRHVWAEARFELPNDPSLSHSVPGVDGGSVGLRFGFVNLQRGVDATIIAPYDADTAADLGQALVDAPAQAVLAALGGLPDSLDAFRAMAPGQLVALHSTEGVTGFTFNASTPVYVASVSEATLWARISAAAHVLATGELDIQLLRDANDQLVVDVGVTQRGDAQEPNMHFRLAADGYWGFQAFAPRVVDVGPFSLDVARIANRTVESKLNKYFQPFKAAVEWNPQVKTRHTVTRLAFDLSPAVTAEQRAELQRALSLASRGVLWYAQLLAARPQSGVSEVLSVDRFSRHPSFYVGLQLPALGMSFHHERRRNIGEATLTIGPTTQQLFWNELEKNRGWFWTEKNYKAAGIASLTTERGRPVDADHNLRINLVEKQGRLLRDEILDQVDPLLAVFIGQPAVEQLAVHTDAIERYVSRTTSCPGFMSDDQQAKAEWQDCMLQRPGHAAVFELQAAAERALDELLARGAVRDGMDGQFDTAQVFARQLLALKIAAQKLPQSNEWSPPEGLMQVQARLSARAIAEILGRDDARQRFEEALTTAVGMVNVWRTAPRGHQCSEIYDSNRNTTSTYCSDNPDLPTYRKRIRQVADEFFKQAQSYRRIAALARVSFRARETGQHTAMGDHGIVVDVDRAGQLVRGAEGEDVLAAGAIAERKAEALRTLFEKVVDEAEPPAIPVIGRLFGGLGHTEHQIVAFALLLLAQPAEIELLLNTRFSDEPERGNIKAVALPDLRIYGRGAEAKLIDAGRFGLESVIAVH